MDRWTMEVVSDTDTATEITLYFRGRKIDVMSLVRILNEKERQISWLESQVDQCQEQDKAHLKSFCDILEKYRDKHTQLASKYKELRDVLHQQRNKRTLLQEEYFELKKIADELAGAGDGLTLNPNVPGRDEREKAWIEAYTAWINFEERVG